jgi:hypothetical protein
MASFLQKYEEFDEIQLSGMIAHAQRQFPYLESSSPEALMRLCRLMIDTQFMFDKKATPVRSAFEFLRKITETNVQNQQTGTPMFAERDYIFAIKMFGLAVRLKNGVNQFVPSNKLDIADDEEVVISGAKDAKSLEFYVSDVHKRTKIQMHAIESATNRLLREWREIELAKLFSSMMQKDGKTIGQAREYLRTQCGVKDHEFVRIRKHAINLGVFQSKRNPLRVSRRVTLDEDVAPYVALLTNTLAKNKNQLTPSQAVNQALRDLHKMTTEGPLPKAVKMEKQLK